MNNLPRKKKESIFFFTTACYFLIANIIGFGTSLNARIENEGALPFHIYLHAVCAALWIILYFVQSSLIISGKVKFHTLLGKAGAVILLLILLTGFYVAFMVPVLYNVEPPYSQPGRDFSAILLAVGTAAFGLKFRKSPFIHKRLILFATLLLSSAGIGRAANALGLTSIGPTGVISLLFLPIIALFLFDFYAQRKVFKINFVGLLTVCLLFLFSAPPFWDNQFFQPIFEILINWLS